MLIYNDKKTTYHIMILADPRASKLTQVSGFSIPSSFATNPLPSCYILYFPVLQFKGHTVLLCAIEQNILSFKKKDVSELSIGFLFFYKQNK